MEDLDRIKSNVAKMVEQNAPETDIDAYIAGEGVTIEQVREHAGTPKRGVMEDIAVSGGRGFNKGLNSFLNVPTALANAAMMGIDAIPGVDAGFRFKEPLEAVAPEMYEGIVNPESPHTAAGNVAMTVGEYAGANAVPSAGLIAAAPKMAAATANATTTTGRVVNSMAKPVAAAPGKAAAGEALSSVGSGVAAQLSRDMAPDNPTAEFIAATFGGLAAPTLIGITPTNLVRKGVNTVRKKFSPSVVDAKNRETISKVVQKNLTPETVENIQQTEAIRKDIPGYEPSVAEATESPSFIATQKHFEGELEGAELDRAIDRYSLNDKAIVAAKERQAPTSEMAVDEAFEQGRDRVTSITDKIGAEDAALTQKEKTIALQQESGIRKRDVGENLREHLINERGATKEEMSITAKEFGLNDEAADLPFGDYKDQLIESVAPLSKLDDSSAAPNAIIADIKAMDDNASIVDLMRLRSRVSADIREAGRTPSGEKKLPYLERLKSEIDIATDSMLKAVDKEDVANNLRTFRDIYLQDYVMPFEQGTAGRVLKKDITGAYKVNDEDVAAEFFGGWNQTSADQFNTAFKNNPAAKLAMEAAAVDDLHTFAVRDGVFDPNLVDTWKRRNQGVLKDFPDINTRVSNIEDAVEKISQRRAVLASRKKVVEKAYLSKELDRIDNPMGNVTPDSAVDQAIKSPSRMRKLLGGLKSPEAKMAVSRRAWETALDSGSPVEFLTVNREALSQALGGKYATAMRLAKAIEKNKLVARPSGKPVDTNPVSELEGKFGTGLNQISSRVFAVKSGRTSARYALTDLAGRAFRSMSGASARQALNDAIYDPQAAIALVEALETGTMTEIKAKRLYTFLISNGIVAYNQDDVSTE